MKSILLADIESFLIETGMGEYRFGLLAANNGRLVERMKTPGRNGRMGRVWPETEAKIRNFMAAERERRLVASEVEAAE